MLPLLDVMLKVGVTAAALPGLVDILRRQEDQPAVVRTVLRVLSGIPLANGEGFKSRSLLAKAVPVLGRIGLEVYVPDLDIVKLATKLMVSASQYIATVEVLVPLLPSIVRVWEWYPHDEELARIISDLVFSAAIVRGRQDLVLYVPVLMRIAASYPKIGGNAMHALVLQLKKPPSSAGVVEYLPAVVAWLEASTRETGGVLDAMSVVLHFSGRLSDDAIARLGRVTADIVTGKYFCWIFRNSMPTILGFITTVQAGIGCSDLERISTMYNPARLGLNPKGPTLTALATELLVRCCHCIKCPPFGLVPALVVWGVHWLSLSPTLPSLAHRLPGSSAGALSEAHGAALWCVRGVA